jgi:hypothetical protein
MGNYLTPDSSIRRALYLYEYRNSVGIEKQVVKA